MFRQDVSARLSTRLLRLEAHTSQDGGTTLLMVVDALTEHVRPLAERLLQESFRTGPAPMLELMDRSTFEMLRRLSRAGVVFFFHHPAPRGHAVPKCAVQDLDRSFRPLVDLFNKPPELLGRHSP